MHSCLVQRLANSQEHLDMAEERCQDVRTFGRRLQKADWEGGCFEILYTENDF